MSQPKRIVVGTVGLAVLIMVGTAVRRMRAPRRAPSGEDREPVEVRIGFQENTVCALMYIAANKGFFLREGVAVRMMPYPSGKLALKAMLDGEVDVATCADMPIMANSFGREDYALFGTIASTEDGAWIIARKDKDIGNPADLGGKRIATQKNSAVHFFLSAFLVKHQIAEEDVELLFMKAVDLPSALVEGEIDAFSMRNPFINAAKESLGDRAVEFFGRDVYCQTFNLVAFRSTLDGRLDDLRRVVAALAAAEQLLVKDGDAAIESAIEWIGQDRAEEIRSDWHRYEFALSLDQSLFLTLEDQARWARQKGLVPEDGATPNFGGFIDVRVMDAVKPEAVTIIR